MGLTGQHCRTLVGVCACQPGLQLPITKGSERRPREDPPMRTKLAIFLLLTATCVWAQAPEGHGPQAGPGMQMQMRGGTAGTISAIKDNALVIKQLNGESATVNLSDKTEYRKER